MTWEAVEATARRAEHDKAENAKIGTFICNRCADTGIIPAPEPYGLWGCKWFCPECELGEDIRLDRYVVSNVALQNVLLEARNK